MAWDMYSRLMNGLGQYINGPGHIQQINEWPRTIYQWPGTIYKWPRTFTAHSWMAQDIYNTFMDGPGHLQHIYRWPGTLTTHSWMA
jgi:hypothetical protein